jgi:CTP:molybdopterin cytidylyltransferase MocA
MGRIKQLLPLPDRPAIRRCLESLFAGGVSDVIVVIAPESPVAAAVQDLPVRIVCNDDPASDMAGSVQAGLAAAEPGRSILVCPADHPLVMPGTIAAILAEGAASPERIIIPTFQGRSGHPTLFPREVIDTLAAGGTLHDAIARHGDAVSRLPVSDEGVVLDMDTEEDYERLRRRAGGDT